MNRYQCGVLIAASIACFVSSSTWAQAVLPSDGDMRLARQRMEEALKGIVPASVANPLSVPKTDALPKPVAKSPDISQIAESYRRTSSVNVPSASSFGQNVQSTVQQRVNSYYNQ